MKHLKTLALAAVAAAALTALIGAATASATVICGTSGTASAACPAGAHEFESTAPIEASSSNATLKTSIATVICPASATTVEPSSSTGSPVTGSISALSFGPGCHLNNAKETACTVEVLNLPYSGEVEAAGSGFTLVANGNPGAHVTCGAIINCTFTESSVELTGENTGSGVSVKASEVSLSRSGGLCPATANWSATYAASGVTVH